MVQPSSNSNCLFSIQFFDQYICLISLTSHKQLIGEDALAQLRPNFPKILPRLYRARFDPDPKTSSAMNRLWKALCGGEGANATDEIKVVREHFAAILNGTLPALTARHWREAISSNFGA